jgi:hypothetical protein
MTAKGERSPNRLVLTYVRRAFGRSRATATTGLPSGDGVAWKILFFFATVLSFAVLT